MLHLPYHCNQPNTSASQPPYLTHTLYRSIVTRAQWLDTLCTGIVTGEDSLLVHNVIYFFSFFSYKDVALRSCSMSHESSKPSKELNINVIIKTFPPLKL